MFRLTFAMSLFALTGLLSIKPAYAAADACEQENDLAQQVANARERGIPEHFVTEKARSMFPDPQMGGIVASLVHVIYTDPAFQGLTPQEIGSAVGQVCANGRTPNSP